MSEYQLDNNRTPVSCFSNDLLYFLVKFSALFLYTDRANTPQSVYDEVSSKAGLVCAASEKFRFYYP